MEIDELLEDYHRQNKVNDLSSKLFPAGAAPAPDTYHLLMEDFRIKEKKPRKKRTNKKEKENSNAEKKCNRPLAEALS